MQDIFPDVEPDNAADAGLTAALQQAACEAGMQPVPALLEKASQLDGTLGARFGVMLVGPAAAGKTTAYRTLLNARNVLSHDCGDGGFVSAQVLNPKALALEELYGRHNALTGEWRDGLAAHIFRSAMDDNAVGTTWVVFDGPVDAVWVESLNTVLDDSRTLCLPSGERMKLHADKMRVLFEVEDLAAATPATVSRCGMVFVPVATASVAPDPLYASWLQALPQALGFPHADCAADGVATPAQMLLEDLRAFFCKYVPPAEAWLRSNATECIPTAQAQRIASLTAWLQALLLSAKPTYDLGNAYPPAARVAVEYMFAFAFVWGLGGALDASCHEAWDKHVRQLFNGAANFPGGAGSVFDFCCAPERGYHFQVRFWLLALCCLALQVGLCRVI